jgi:hypothetical protein
MYEVMKEERRDNCSKLEENDMTLQSTVTDL